MPKKTTTEPDVVHQTRHVHGVEIETKCGLTGRADKLRHSSWHSDITCAECLPCP